MRCAKWPVRASRALSLAGGLASMRRVEGLGLYGPGPSLFQVVLRAFGSTQETGPGTS